MLSIRHFLHLAFIVVLVFLSQALDAANLDKKLDPKNPLQVRLDYALVTKSNQKVEAGHQWVFSSHIAFNGNVEDITDGQLAKMVQDAFVEMEADILQYEPNRDKNGKPRIQPGAMSILATGNEIFFSSSQKGKEAFINLVEDSPVKDQLELCLATWKDSHPNTDKPDHKNSRKCGEIMTFHQYYKIHSERLGNLSPLARLTTVTRLRSGDLLLIPPCGTNTDEVWGCNLFLVDLEAPTTDEPRLVARYLPGETASEDYDLMTLAGGVDYIDQIESCGSSS